MKKIFNKLTLVSLCLSLAVFAGCSGSKKATERTVAVFVPGIMADSPIYAKLAKGVQTAIDEFNKNLSDADKVQVFVLEAGTNQAEWSGKLTSLAAAGKYEVIVSSNPSLPDLCKPLTEQFPKQKFLLLDAACEGNENIAAISYDQKQQSYLTGYIAGLMSKTKKLGLVAAQEYPVMNNIILPYYTKGAQDAAGASVDFRIVGNWYDASKGAELADALNAAGVDVILPICGGAAQGVISSAKENGTKLVFFDDNVFARAPGNIISCCLVKQEDSAKKAVLSYLNKEIKWGSTKTVDFSDGYFEFVQDDPNYISAVPQDIREKMSVLVKDFTEGKKL